MHTALRKAGLDTLLSRPETESTYDFDTLLDDGSMGARRLSKKKVQLLVRIDDRLREILYEGERVRYVTWGSGVSFLESYFIGWTMYYLNRRAIVLTDRRIILLQIDSKRRPRELVSQVRYASVKRVKTSVFGNTKLKLADGKGYLFAYVPRRDRKFLRDLGDRIHEHIAADAAGWEDLCPHCYSVVEGRPPSCPGCGKPFKSARRAGLLSLVFPGLGDLYIGHWKFAILEILVTLGIWVAVFIPDPAYPYTVQSALLTAAVIIVVVHGADAVATWYIARKGLYPA